MSKDWIIHLGLLISQAIVTHSMYTFILGSLLQIVYTFLLSYDSGGKSSILWRIKWGQ